MNADHIFMVRPDLSVTVKHLPAFLKERFLILHTLTWYRNLAVWHTNIKPKSKFYSLTVTLLQKGGTAWQHLIISGAQQQPTHGHSAFLHSFFITNSDTRLTVEEVLRILKYLSLRNSLPVYHPINQLR